MSRLITTITILAVTSLGVGQAANADTGGSANTGRSGIYSGASNGSGHGGKSGTGRVACRYLPFRLKIGVPIFNERVGPLGRSDGTGRWYEKWCNGVYMSDVYISRADPADLLAEARRYLPLPLPTPRLSPAGEQIVNLPTWMWLARGWTRERSTVSVPGVAVTVDAEPVSATWSMGDGSQVVCDGPGTAYNPALPASTQTPSCSHTFTRSSASQPDEAYTVSVSVRWLATWRVTGAPGGGDLGMIDRTTTLRVRVGEVEAINAPAA